MKVGDLVRIDRGVATGNRRLFVMAAAEAKRNGIDRFVRPALVSIREFPKDGPPVVHATKDSEVILLASRDDVDQNPSLRAYLGETSPRLWQVKPAPIALSYVGTPRFVANPDGLIATNSLYVARPLKELTSKEVLELVQRFNAAMAKMPKPRFAERRSPREIENLEV